jgi:hypothetical protein
MSVGRSRAERERGFLTRFVPNMNETGINETGCFIARPVTRCPSIGDAGSLHRRVFHSAG